MKRLRYDIGQKVQVVNIPLESVDAHYNYKLAKVVEQPGWNPLYKDAYAIMLPDGSVRPAVPRFLRLDPNKPAARGDIDTPISWAHFEASTGISSAMIRSGNRNPDY